MTSTDTMKSTQEPRRFDWITFLSRWGTLISLGLLIVYTQV